MYGRRIDSTRICRFLAVFATVLVIGCSGGGGGGGSDNGGTSDTGGSGSDVREGDTDGGSVGGVQETIGSDGGTITSADGRLTIEIPSGALSASETITIAPLAGKDLQDPFVAREGSAYYEVEPSGLTFDKPVTATYNLDRDPVRTDGTIEMIISMMMTRGSDDKPEYLENLRREIDPATGQEMVRGELNHFSPIIIDKDGITLEIKGVPTEPIEVHDSFDVEVIASEDYSDMTLDPASSHYKDHSDPALRPKNESFGLTRPNSRKSTLTGKTSYECTETGKHDFFATVEVGGVSFPGPAISANMAVVEHLANDSGEDTPTEFLPARTVKCVAAKGGERLHPTEMPAPEDFDVLEGPNGSVWMAIPGENGAIVYDLLTGKVVSRVGRTLKKATGVRVFERPSGDLQKMFIFGQSLEQRVIGEKPGITSALFRNEIVTDLAIYGETPKEGGVVTNNSRGSVLFFRWDDNEKDWELASNSEAFIYGNTINDVARGTSVSAYADSIKGPVYVATDSANGMPGQLWSHDLSDPMKKPTEIGDLGMAPRRIRCLEKVCAVTNFESDTLTVAVERSAGLEIVGTVDVGDGPVGVHLKKSSGGNVLALTTGSAEGSFHVTELDSNGNKVSQSSYQAPTECKGPGFARWHDKNSVVMTCSKSDRFARVPLK